MDDNVRHSSAFRREDNRRLQVVVNRVLRILLKKESDTPTITLCELSGQLSVHQRVAYSSLCTIFKTIASQQPKYFFELLKCNESRQHRHGNQNNCAKINYNLSISRDSLLYRGSKLYNMLPVDIASATNLKEFKKDAKQWVLNNVPVHPE